MSVSAFTSMISHSQTNSNGLSDVSFTSYLNGAEDSFVCKLAEPSLELIPRAAAHEYHENDHLGRKKADDGEIGVFSAEKYFAAPIDEGSLRISSMTIRKKNEQKDAVPEKLKVLPGTLGIHSESGWNSQSALLQAVLRNPSRRKTDKVKGKSFLAVLGCKCSCSDKDSVDIHNHAGEVSFSRRPDASSVQQGKSVVKEQIKTSIDSSHELFSGSGADKLGNGLAKETCFTFPIPNSSPGNLAIKNEHQKKEEFMPRKSLEVFGPPIHDKRSKFFNLERRLTMLSEDANPRVDKIEFSATPGGVYNDNESDASSDLIEIESFSGKVIPYPARVSDATSGYATPKTCYAPSEASIEWSVVTASAADFSADNEELRPPAAGVCPIRGLTANAKTGVELPSRRPGVLLGCKSQDAAKVAGDTCRKNEKVNFDKQMCRVSDSYMPLTRFQAETKHAELSSTQSKIVLATHSLP
uniref:Protein PHYTOCHROME KINASE SUBSTRATE 1 n=1 Tax=Rhizophora mucronata TaxID=61149 RepID=A0A2P2NZH7_RHIMU